MKPQLKSSRAARELIKAHEPFRPEAVRRGRRWVVGYGHTTTAREGVTVSRDDAELLMIYDVLNAEQAVEAGVGESLVRPVRDALVSFACSIGPGAFKVSDVARLAKAGRMEDAARAMETWVRAEEDGRLVVSDRLVARRAAEKSLFLKGLESANDADAEASSRSDATGSGESAAGPSPIAVIEPEVADIGASLGDDLEETAQPRLGPLVDLEIEFEDPPEGEADTGEALGLDQVEDNDTPLDRALGPEPDSEPDASLEPAEAALERSVGPVEDIKDEPAVDLAEEGTSPHEASVEPADPSIETPTASSSPEKAEQDATVQRVMTRMAREIATSVSVPTSDSDSAAPEVSPEVQLGYAFLQPIYGQAKLADSGASPAPAAVAPVKADSAPVSAAPADKRFVYGTVSVGPVPVRGAPVTVQPPVHDDGPAPAPGFSGEVGGVTRPAEFEELDYTDEEELHPELVAGREAHDAFHHETSQSPSQADGRWIYALNFTIGAGLGGFGAWDLIRHFDLYQREGFLVTGPVSLALGLVLMTASGWMLATRAKPSDDTPVRSSVE